MFISRYLPVVQIRAFFKLTLIPNRLLKTNISIAKKLKPLLDQMIWGVSVMVEQGGFAWELRWPESGFLLEAAGWLWKTLFMLSRLGEQLVFWVALRFGQLHVWICGDLSWKWSIMHVKCLDFCYIGAYVSLLSGLLALLPTYKDYTLSVCFYRCGAWRLYLKSADLHIVKPQQPRARFRHFGGSDMLWYFFLNWSNFKQSRIYLFYLNSAPV